MSIMSVYSTTNIVEAAYLKDTRHVLLNITKEGRTGTFHFENVQQSTVDNFSFGNCIVEPSSFHNHVQQLSKAVRMASDITSRLP